MGGYFQVLCVCGRMTLEQHHDAWTLEPVVGPLLPAWASAGFESPMHAGLSHPCLESRGEDPPQPGNLSVLLRPPAYSTPLGEERKERWEESGARSLFRYSPASSFKIEFGFFMYVTKLSISWFENVKYGNTIQLILNKQYIYFSLGNLRAWSNYCVCRSEIIKTWQVQ